LYIVIINVVLFVSRYYKNKILTAIRNDITNKKRKKKKDIVQRAFTTNANNLPT